MFDYYNYCMMISELELGYAKYSKFRRCRDLVDIYKLYSVITSTFD